MTKTISTATPCPKCGGKLLKKQTLVSAEKLKCEKCRAEFFSGVEVSGEVTIWDFARDRFSNAHG